MKAYRFLAQSLAFSFLSFGTAASLDDTATTSHHDHIIDTSRELQDEDIPIQIVELIPGSGDTIATESYEFLAEVMIDGGDTEVEAVRFQLRYPDDSKSPFEVGDRVDESDVWAHEFALPEEGSHDWRIRVNGITTDWQPFLVKGDPAVAIAAAREAISSLIAAEPALSAKFVRLGFHDCVGGCDGCVDLSNGDNNGLDIPIEALAPVVDVYATPATGLTRADIWALSALTGADVTQIPNQERVEFPMDWYGRANCEDVHEECFDGNDPPQQRPCKSRRGPHRDLPGPDQTTHEVLDWFATEFGFDARQVVALMGAHTLGGVGRANSGFNGTLGWVNNNRVLSNGYYDMLVGGNNGVNDTLETKIHAPAWDLAYVNNSDIEGNVPNRFQWQHLKDPNRTIIGPDNPNQNDTSARQLEHLIMLNADIALVRDLTGFLNATTGEVTGCQFRCRNGCTNPPRCPHAADTLDMVAEFKHDNVLWKNEFQDVFTAMLVHGFDVSVACAEGPPCVLGEPVTDTARNLRGAN